MPPARPAGLTAAPLTLGCAAIAIAALVSVTVGPVSIAPHYALIELVNLLPWVDLSSGASDLHAAIVSEIRAPRLVLGLLVGAMLSMSGAAFQGALRNPLADSFLLGVAAGAGVGVSLVVVWGWTDGAGFFDILPLAAFAGALLATACSLSLGSAFRVPESSLTIILAGVAVASFFTAAQTYIQVREIDSLRLIYGWLLGRLTTSGWGEVALLLPYFAVCTAVLWLLSGRLDLLAVGDEESASLGLRPKTIRAVTLGTASLATAAAVSVSGLIGFVGLVVPHAVRLVFGVSNRVVLPLSLLFGAAFLALADVAARTVTSPSELPIGVVTGFLGAPFFLLILHRHTRGVHV